MGLSSRQLLIALTLLAIPQIARADVPKLNVEPSCRAAADAAKMGALAGANTRDLNSCMRDENEAKDALAKEWHEFSASDQQRCVRETTTGGSPSYVELLVCLEMIRDASGQDPLPMGKSNTAKPDKRSRK